ncbi:choice-of-anchor D domain-containing protein [Lacinutrix undariae]
MKKNYSSLLLITFLCLSFSGYGQNYSQISTLAELTDGNYLIVGDGTSNDGLMKNETAGSVIINYTSISNPGATITTGYTNANIFNLTVSGGNITIYNSNEGYASWGRSGVTANNADFYNGTIANTERWTPFVSGGLWTLKNVSNNSRILQWNNSSPRFAAYTSEQIKLKLYKEVVTTPTPEIEIQGNATEITSGDTTPDFNDHTNFGNITISGDTQAQTFTILNTGTADLTLNSITSSNPTEFSITGTTTGNITSGNSVTFTVTFNPNIIGNRTAIITIDNSDDNESSYTFTIQGNGTNSNASDIIVNSAFTYNSNIDYTAYQATTINNTAQSTDVLKFDIRDGGNTTDTDVLGTELTDITFNAVNNENIRSAALFNGNALISNAGIISGNTISFSGLSYTAADDSSASLSLRVTFLTNVTDNDQLQFTISAATANTTGSVFETPNAGGATSSILNNRNRIEVTADRIAFATQPTSTTINTNLNSFNISAVDIFGNTDLDETLNITINTSGTGISTTSPYILTNGELAISDIQFNLSQTAINLTATTTGLTFSNTITSSDFDIIDVAIGTYRTTSNGTWPSGTATWERLTTTGWITAIPAANTTELLIIRHNITSIASFAAPSPYTTMVVENTASFNDAHNSTFGSLLVKDGGEFIVSDPGVDINPSGTLTVENNGTLVINSSTLNNADGLFDGIENFESNSIVEIRKYDNDSSNGEDDIIDNDNTISLNSEGYYFGNLFINFTPDSANDGKALTLVGKIGNHKLCNNLTVINNNILKSVILTNVNANVEIAGNVTVQHNKFAFAAVGSSNLTHTVKGHIIADGGIIDLNQQSAGAATVLVNVEGDLIGTLGTIQSTDDDCGIAFTGNTLQNINVTNAVPYKNINTYIRNTANVQLLNNNLKLSNSSTFTVENGGTFNFNWAADNSTPLLISNGGGGTNTFHSEEGAILKITHLDGLVKNTANAGNVQLSISNKKFNQTAIFHFIGKENQFTGDGISIGSTGKIVYVNLSDNTKTLSLTNNIGIANSTNLDPNGGKLDIQQGIVLGTNTGDFTGSGRLVMSDGEYRISTITTNPLSDYLPLLSGYSNYNLSGGIVNLNGDNETQILSGSPTYYNLNFSGTNTYSTLPPLPPISNYKGISNATKVSNNITIYEDAIVNVGNKSLGATNSPSFTMLNNSRYITDGGGQKPDTSGAYNLAPNTIIEYANNTGAGIIRIGSPKIDYANIEVTGTNVSNNSETTGIHFQNGGTFTVKPYAIFKIASTAGFNGSNATAVDTDNNPTITLEDNSTIEYKGDLATQTITNYTPEYKTVILSGNAAKTLGHATDILIGEDLNIISSSLTVNTNEAITVDESVNVDTSANFNILNSGSLIQINETSSNTGNINMERKASVESLDYIYWSSPVSNYNVNTISSTSNIYKWNPIHVNTDNGTQGNWESAAGEVMIKGVGYIVRGFGDQAAPATVGELNFTANFNNVPFNGFTEVTVQRGSLSGIDDNWNLVGNPYPSAIDVYKFLTNTTNQNTIDGFVNLWTHGNAPSEAVIDPFYADFGSNYTETDYIAYNATGAGNGPGNIEIAAGQSFMVNILETVPTTSQIEFTNTMRHKNYDNSQFYRTSEINYATAEKHRIWLDLISENQGTNRILVGYIDGATQERDRMYDAVASSTGNQNLYSLINNTPFIIQGRDVNFNDTDVVPLGVELVNSGIYNIAIATVDGLFDTENQDIYIKDNLTGITFNITNAPYTFTSEAGTFNSRFELVFRAQTLSLSNALLDAKDLSIIELNTGDIKFSVNANFKIKNIDIIDTLGRTIYHLQGDSNIETYTLSQLSEAAYIAKVTLSNGQVITKKAIKRY